MHESPRADLATTIIDAESLLEAVREIQHEGPAVAKAALVRDVVASISRNCDVMGESDQLITNLTIQMYGGGAAVDWHPGAPTPQRAPTPGTP